MTTFQKTQRFLAQRFHLREAEITPDCTLQSLGIDSLAALELQFAIEDEFGIRLSHDHREFTTLRDLVDVVELELARQCTTPA